jgi:acyl-coenzyme A thioesterase PaaI-like protein
MGYAAWTAVLKESKFVSTIEFKMNYFAPVRVGQTVSFEAKTLYRGRSHIVAECVGYVDDKPVVKSLGTFNVYSLRSKPRDETYEDNRSSDTKAKL